MNIRPKHRVSAKVFIKSPDGTAVLMTHITEDRYGIPGGHIEMDETPQQAAVRELHEELGITASDILNLQVHDFWKDEVGNDRIIVAFTADLREGAEIHPDNKEVIGVRWVTPEMFETGEVVSPTYRRKVSEFLHSQNNA